MTVVGELTISLDVARHRELAFRHYDIIVNLNFISRINASRGYPKRIREEKVDSLTATRK